VYIICTYTYMLYTHITIYIYIYIHCTYKYMFLLNRMTEWMCLDSRMAGNSMVQVYTRRGMCQGCNHLNNNKYKILRKSIDLLCRRARCLTDKLDVRRQGFTSAQALARKSSPRFKKDSLPSVTMEERPWTSSPS
jgi:hypothetical protein